jgi:sensor histidine kinase YesM
MALDGTKHGLKNIRERLDLAYGKKATMICSNNNGAIVEISIPRGEFNEIQGDNRG